MAAKQKDKAIGPLRATYPYAFWPMLAALAFLVAMRLVLLKDAAVAAGGGTVVALWMLWPLTPWMQRRYNRTPGRTRV
jgi:hypothetical protein